jgi:ATP-binding cassette subfamily B protein RaxB
LFSGFGKTTLIKIMMGLLKPVTGRVLFDGYGIRDIGLSNYRGFTSAVMQNDKLLSGTIAQNISLHAVDIDMERVIECAEKANIMEDINNMPMGLNTLVGDMGSTLSGGQLQRVFIARALYSEPTILFLDEATSHLDHISEQKVNDAISKCDVTRIIIAHRQETIKMADRVIDLNSLCNIHNIKNRRW